MKKFLLSTMFFVLACGVAFANGNKKSETKPKTEAYPKVIKTTKTVDIKNDTVTIWYTAWRQQSASVITIYTQPAQKLSRAEYYQQNGYIPADQMDEQSYLPVVIQTKIN